MTCYLLSVSTCKSQCILCAACALQTLSILRAACALQTLEELWALPGPCDGTAIHLPQQSPRQRLTGALPHQTPAGFVRVSPVTPAASALIPSSRGEGIWSHSRFCDARLLGLTLHLSALQILSYYQSGSFDQQVSTPKIALLEWVAGLRRMCPVHSGMHRSRWPLIKIGWALYAALHDSAPTNHLLKPEASNNLQTLVSKTPLKVQFYCQVSSVAQVVSSLTRLLIICVQERIAHLCLKSLMVSKL